MREPLDLHVVNSYRSMLDALGLTHVSYVVDREAFGNEIDRYRNDRIFVDFVRDHRDETDYVQVIPIAHEEHRFDSIYLLEMLEPQAAPSNVSESVALLPTVIAKVYAMFESPQYVCFRRAYNTFENCRNLWGIESLRQHFEDHVK
jgi:hypothetical protein